MARRISHEIKNPLTPIQLSAERLRRKYLKQIANDPDTFQMCTDTIVRQVDDIRRMVDEFSAFARMPAPVMASENLVELCAQAIFLQQAANPSITYSTDLPPDGLTLTCDAQQIGQALKNLVFSTRFGYGGGLSLHPLVGRTLQFLGALSGLQRRDNLLAHDPEKLLGGRVSLRN